MMFTTLLFVLSYRLMVHDKLTITVKNELKIATLVDLGHTFDLGALFSGKADYYP